MTREAHETPIVTRTPLGLLFAAALPLLMGCGSSKTMVVKTPEQTGQIVRTLATAPSGDPDHLINVGSQLADYVGAELSRRGYTVIDVASTIALMRRHDIPSGYASASQGMAALAEEKVDAILVVNSSSSQIGGPQMRHVNAKVVSVRTAKDVAGVEWHNAWGGMPGSPADYTMRKGPAEAAKEIAAALANALR